MKNISILFLFILLFVSCKNNDTETLDTASLISKKENQDLKRYKVKSGMITYKTTISGNIMGGVVSGSGTENKYFRNWGSLELVEEESTKTTTIKMFGQNKKETETTHTINKFNNGESYYVDFKHKKIYANRDLAMDMTKIFQPNQDAGAVGKSMAEGMGGKIIGKENYLGYECEIMELMGSKQWIYKGVTLKLEMTVMGISTLKEATSAKFNVSVSDTFFELPDFPIIKQKGFMSNEEFNKEMNNEDYQDEIDALKNMTFEEWKSVAIKEDEEMRNMSDQELRETYDMMQKMIQLQN